MKSQKENMNIALVHDWLTNVAGAERVLLSIKKIYPSAPIFTSVFDPKKAKAFSSFDVKTSFLQRLPFAKTKREVLIPLTPFAFEQFNLAKFDVAISSTTMAAKGIITKPSTTHICYCHTPPRYLWEPEVDPRADSGLFSGLRKKTAHSMRIWDRVAADRVDFFIANSEYVKRRIRKYYNRDAEVVYPPVNTGSFKVAPPKKVKDYFLFVSRLVPYKKCDLVIEAFNDLGLPLKIIGSGPEKKRLKKMANKNIEFLGYLSDKDLAEYYSEAKAFVFAAEEDFGIVPVEAMASGRPVVAYGKGGATESIVDGKTGVLFMEQTPQCLIDAVKNFDPENFDPQYIKKHSEKFSEENFIKNFTKTVDKFIKEHKK